MTIHDALVASSLDHLDAEVLLAHVLGVVRTHVVAHPQQALTAEQERHWQQLRLRRANREPVAYITGSKEFYGRNFRVTPTTLIPRPSTESLVAATLDLLENKKEETKEVEPNISIITRVLRPKSDAWDGAMIVDVGCGSGCIGITLALEHNASRAFMMIDLSPQAMDIARHNTVSLGVQSSMRWIVGDGSAIIASLSEPFILVSNPPYIPNTETLMDDVQNFEPHLALFAGNDGLAMIRPLLSAAKANDQCLAIALECRNDQIERIQKEIEKV